MNEIDTIYARWLSGDLSPEELASLEGTEEFERIKQIRAASAGLQPPPPMDKGAAWNKLAAKLDFESADDTAQNQDPVLPKVGRPPVQSSRRSPRRRRNLMFMASAAAIALIAVVILVLPGGSGEATIIADAGQSLEHRLPDGSLATLNGPAELTYFKGKWKDKRYLELKGEGFFDVKKGPEFVVTTASGSVKVLGTSFNVRTQTEKLTVSCFTGKVMVSNPEGKTITTLSPGQGVAYTHNKVPMSFEVDADAGLPGWQNGKISLRNAPLEVVVNEMEQAFSLTIEYPSLQDKRISVDLERSDLKGALEQLDLIHNLKSERTDDKTLKLYFE